MGLFGFEDPELHLSSPCLKMSSGLHQIVILHSVFQFWCTLPTVVSAQTIVKY